MLVSDSSVSPLPAVSPADDADDAESDDDGVDTSDSELSARRRLPLFCLGFLPPNCFPSAAETSGVFLPLAVLHGGVNRASGGAGES